MPYLAAEIYYLHNVTSNDEHREGGIAWWLQWNEYSCLDNIMQIMFFPVIIIKYTSVMRKHSTEQEIATNNKNQSKRIRSLVWIWCLSQSAIYTIHWTSPGFVWAWDLFIARSLIIERHGLRFNGWLMNAILI